MGDSGGSSVDTNVRKSNSEVVLSEIPDKSKTTSQYQIKPSLKEGFQGLAIKEIISNVLVEVLDGRCFLMHFFRISTSNKVCSRNETYHPCLLQVNNTQATRYRNGQVKFLILLVCKSKNLT